MTSTSNSDLISWLKLFWTNDGSLTYDSILDAYFLNEVFREIDPNATANDQLSSNDNMMDKVKNWEILIKNIRIYYAEVLQQAIVVRLPSIVAISREQNSQKFQKEIDKAIFLILGAAIQCEKKEYFIQDIITRLPDESIQRGLMGFIKQITENVDMIINYQNLSQLSAHDLVFHLRNILEQREDNFLEENKTLLSEINDLQRQITYQKNQMQVLRNVGSDNITGPIALQSNKGIAVELAEYKAKLRKIHNEMDEKNDMISDLRTELEQQQDENVKLKEVQMKLINESRRARLLQDELDGHKESICRLPVIELENTKLKEKVNELEYYKARCEELREDLAVLANENTNLLDKIENNSKVVEQSMKFESEYRKANRKIEELEQARSNQDSEIANLEKQLQSLQEKDILHLSSKSELSDRLKRLQKGNDDGTTTTSISDQMIDKANAKILRLEIENRSLKEKLLEDSKSELDKYQEKMSDLEVENERMSSKILRLQEANKLEIQKFMEAEESRQLVLREKNQLETTIKSAKENDNRKMKELIQENESLSETVLIIRERSEKSNDLRLNELEKENAKLHLTFNESSHKASNLEFDLQRSAQKCNRLDQSLEKSQQDYLVLSKQNGDLNKEVTSLKQFKNRLEELQDKFSSLEGEKLRLEALSAEYCQQLKQSTAITDDRSEEEMKQLAAENQRKTSQFLKKISELESEVLKMKTENEKYNRQNISIDKKNKALQQELETYKTELGNMSRLESKLKFSEKNHEELEKEREQLQSQNMKLEQDLQKIDKDFRRVKNQSEVQSNSIEQHKSRIVDLEKKLYLSELKQVAMDELDSTKASLDESEKRSSDSEKKNRELLLQIKEEKRQCVTLREELLNERLETQNLRNQLQTLTEEFEKLGINEDEANSEKLKQLESKMNTTVGDTIKNKEERDMAFKTKFTSLQNENKELSQKYSEMTAKYHALQQKYSEMSAKYHALQQKYEEELNLRSLRSSSISNSKEVPPYAQYLLELKDDIVKLERQNAHLDSEKQFLGSQCQDLKEKLSATETKSFNELEKLQKRFDDLNSEKMKLHIEESTLKSQLNTLRSDNKNLAKQISGSERSFAFAEDERNNANKIKIQLESQCNTLQKLNDQLSTDYEKVKQELDRQVTQNKALKVELHSKSEQLEKMRRSYDSVKHLQDSLENEKNNLADGARQLINLRIENTNLNEEYQELTNKHYKLEVDMKIVTQENKVLKSEQNREKSLMYKMKEENSKVMKDIIELEKEVLKLESKIEGLNEQNEQLKSDNNKLLHQMKSMLMQNQELLTETLQNRQIHFTEEINLRSRLNQLTRHKERLEEKIMEQYKTIPSTKKPKGGRNKFFKKAKEMLKRRDSRSSVDQDRKSPVEVINRNQRSYSCVTILGDEHDSIKTGEHSSDNHNENSETSDRNLADSDNGELELDFSGPVPKFKASRQSDVDSTSMLSSVSQRVHSQQYGAKPKLIPGSMSIYDRDESEKNQTSELNSYFLELHNAKLEMDKKLSEVNDKSLKSTSDGSAAAKNVVTVKTIVRAHQRPQSVVELGKQDRRTLTNQPLNITGSPTGPSSALTFGRISSKSTAAQSPKEARMKVPEHSHSVVPIKTAVGQCQPGVPIRKASLPSTERVEEEYSDVDFPYTSTQQKPQDQSRRQSNPVRAQSTVPGSASSKEILQRLQRNAGRTTPVANDLRTKSRTQTPSELSRSSNNNTKSAPVHPELSSGHSGASAQIYRTHSRPVVPSVPERNESSSRLRQDTVSRSQTGPPPPPLRKESGKHKLSPDDSSTKSDSSEHSKPKVFYEYGQV